MPQSASERAAMKAILAGGLEIEPDVAGAERYDAPLEGIFRVPVHLTFQVSPIYTLPEGFSIAGRLTVEHSDALPAEPLDVAVSALSLSEVDRLAAFMDVRTVTAVNAVRRAALSRCHTATEAVEALAEILASKASEMPGTPPPRRAFC
ncbi:hypothetical protein CKO28_14185 [Rhodovibrio sodomensis]|uniref:Uncharacterized protein n=1 Tax=Rhodovibrio sodomensis TaxID=1088 RepID=A0ABS1DGE8_9PROT|nr:hypothetical protein [Rhodovibrio sodomensis]MBK1669182.1 hypothetical protein [Rhodovibrio sodomensis]